MKNLSVLLDYEKVLLKQQVLYNVSKRSESAESVKKNIVGLLRYVFEELLEWTPDMVEKYLTNDLIDWLSLRRAIKKIPFPPELNPNKDLFYVACYLYPKKIKYSKSDFVIQVYEKVINKELTKFPKNFFMHSEGIRNTEICFYYISQQLLCGYSTEELYQYFSDPVKADKFLQKTQLKAASKKNFESPLDLLHASLPTEERSDLYYHYYQFQIKMKEVRKK